MIPVIGTAVVNSSYWVGRLILSVDYPVKNFVIINNNGRKQIDKELDELCKSKHRYIENFHVVHLPSNLGVAGSWNLIIKSFMMEPYWIIVNDDVAFSAGLLEKMANSDIDYGLVHANGGDFDIGSWDLFLIRDYVIQSLGLFDENTYPAYCEDADYIMRVKNSNINKKILNYLYFHGDGKMDEYYSSGSQTRKTDPSLEEKLKLSNNKNIEYLTEKWGEGWRTMSPSSKPFNNLPENYTKFDLNFVRSKNLGF